MTNFSKQVSVIAGIITAVALAYNGIAPIWHLPLANEVQKTAAVIVVLLSGILSAFTGQKILDNKAQKEANEEAEKLAAENLKLEAQGFFKGVKTSDELSQTTPNDLAEKHADFEDEGAQGAVYSVDTSSYDAFRNNVIGKAFDIDGYYGAQCWDGAAVLWQQFGLTLSTGGTGAAKGTWTHARDTNKSIVFDLVTAATSLRRGDIIVFGGGMYGHIAFVDSINGDGTINTLGQNQTGSGNGAPFNIIRMSLGNFLGAFRVKAWNVAPQPPAPTPVPPTPEKKPITEDIIKATMRGDYGNGEDRKRNLAAAGYNYSEVQNEINARLTRSTDNFKTPQLGDRVTTTSENDQNGVFLNLAVVNDGQSIFSEINSRGYAVLKKGDTVRCAVPIASLRNV